jgi:hypothetical protein
VDFVANNDTTKRPFVDIIESTEYTALLFSTIVNCSPILGIMSKKINL